MHDNWDRLPHAPELDADEWAERMLAEGDRSARMLGIVLVAIMICVVLAFVALAWPVL